MKKQKTSDVTLNTENPIDVYLDFQRTTGRESKESTNEATQEAGLYTVGVPLSTRDTLKSNPDYKPGPIRIYTRKEIKQYEEDRDG